VNSARSSSSNKRRLAAEVQRRVGIEVDVQSLFDVQVKRIHEYKRQLLNLLYVVTRYHQLRANPDAYACRARCSSQASRRRVT